jgi:hypothetical protein
MSIKVKLNVDWNKISEVVIKEIDERILYAFNLACLDAVTYAKTKHRYKQQTGALNSSTGFQLYKDGALMENYFTQSTEGNDKNGARGMGVSAGQKAAKERAAELGAHICGVVVAGMPYAIYVESKGYDVLTAAYLEFPKLLEIRMEETFRNENIGYSITT